MPNGGPSQSDREFVRRVLEIFSRARRLAGCGDKIIEMSAADNSKFERSIMKLISDKKSMKKHEACIRFCVNTASVWENYYTRAENNSTYIWFLSLIASTMMLRIAIHKIEKQTRMESSIREEAIVSLHPKKITQDFLLDYKSRSLRSFSDQSISEKDLANVYRELKQRYMDRIGEMFDLYGYL